jgi:hypothetical protein
MNRKDDIEQQISLIVQDFHSQISKTLKVVDSKLPNNIEVDQLKRLIRIARDEEPLMIINKCKDKIWDSREQILSENVDYFLAKEYDEYIKKDTNQMFIEGLIGLFKQSHHLLSEKERAYVWKINKRLLQDVIRYKMLIGDHE